MRFSVLGSGSRGNSVYIESGGSAILIDAGFSGKETAARLRRIGRNLDHLDAIFVTHEHHDHIGGVGVVSRRCRLPVYANKPTFSMGERKFGRLHARYEFDVGDTLTMQDFQVRSFSISHDAADPVGYIISNGRVSLGYCTDIGKVTSSVERQLAGCNGLILEFNHDLEMLKNGPYPLHLQQRVKSSHGHLANHDAAAFLKNLSHERLDHVVLAHLSETNNDPTLALQEARIKIGEEFHNHILVAGQNKPTELLSLEKK